MTRAKLAALMALLVGVAGSAPAQVRVNPTGVNVNAMNATTVFLTFGGVSANYRPAESVWCGELESAAPDIGNRCRPGTIFGVLPARYDLSRASGSTGFTDIMSIPPSVSRRAWQDARGGAAPSFFYVRRFENLAGGPDEYVSVTCRLSGGGARVPFALTDVNVGFEGGDDVHFVQAGQLPPPITARIVHNGTGRLVGRWEVVLPGQELPSEEDLLTEGTLPLEVRPGQRRFTMLERFNLFVPPGGSVTLPGPDPARLPTNAEGTYLVLLRIEASDDRESDSNLGSAGAGTGLVHSGAVAGFPMPVLRYVVMGDGALAALDGSSRLTLLAPREGTPVASDSAVRLVWRAHGGAVYYRVELETTDGAPRMQAVVPRNALHYELPTMAWEQTNGVLRWRVTALDGLGRLLRRTSWRQIGTPAAGVGP
jgi:hypothetical protein